MSKEATTAKETADPSGETAPQTVAALSALRYSVEHDAVLGGKYSRHRILIDLASQGKRILELGCADGFISRHLTERGCSVTGVEVDAEAAERARRWCDQVVVCDLNQPDWIGRVGAGFDAVLCGDVLEHLARPELALQQVHKVLAPGGRVIICVPNIAQVRVRLGLLLGRFNYAPTGILDVTHLRFYTYKTARELIQGAGYRIVSYYPMVGGGVLTHWLRALLHRLFAHSMMFVAVPRR